ncbi:DUF2586 family protein [Salmonella enterica subsp. diarizonae]|uniref:DUF2586 domain-containing protein n=1 Tax=Salmonella enterica TaxID=28901 RepID=A0A5T7Y786_SALER|nr:DUF2586 domain-containing protein [Salmonella enterica]ECD4922369.1 DUF2586 family protein [Salmonella enterica subsp. enterica serovar Hadar]ECF2080451.1 DUF2586 family protein [Salmonella enterica subsp. enterica serovar Braenderup]ECF6106416.1 DUF2586 family protein [Salmonella enterica subsp. diarizonae]EEO5475605.1 DUF2586 family protein [Salmonella enterica subsp. enterica serovar Muenchen]HAD3353109.1 DUF2586 family protein [Salmonella enterica subsp. enterica serovar Typhimurium]
MTFPQVTINQLNTRSGGKREIARTLLMVGEHTKAITPTPVTAQTDLDALLGTKSTPLRSNVQAFLDNAGQNAMIWLATVQTPQPAGQTQMWTDVVMDAQATVSAEGVIVVRPDATADDINKAQQLREELTNKYQRWTWFILAVRGCGTGEKWAEYVTAMTALQKDIAAYAVQLAPMLFGNEPGVLAGRLCNPSVTIADSPARVATGALVNIGRSDKPQDSDKRELDLATIKALNRARFSVPTWYPDYEGYYWADGVTLDVDGGDYQAIEYLRVADEMARQVRLLAIPKIANRSLNSTPTSVATHQQLFAKPMRDGAKSLKINGTVFPGLCMSPRDGDVQITWPEKDKVQIAIVVRPYNCPKEITISIMLDESGE